jgi:hypothetical protein
LQPPLLDPSRWWISAFSPYARQEREVPAITLGDVFRRRQRASAQPAAPEAPPTHDGAAKPTGKGRPTPKRSEAERTRRARVNPPKDRREWARQQREEARRRRQQAREGLMRGEERFLPPRDRGPVRGFLRDLVDARRNAGEFMLPGLFTVLVLSLLPWYTARVLSSWLWLVLIGAVVGDSIALAIRAKRRLRERFPDAPTRGATAYVLLRSMQVRRFRLPPPRVKPGAKV